MKAKLTVTEKRTLARKEALVAYDERVGRTPKPVVWAATKKRKTNMARKMGGGVMAAMSHTHTQRPAADLSAEWVCKTCSMKNPLAAPTCSICARPATVTAQSKPRRAEQKERNKVASNIPHQPGIGRIPGVMSSRRRRAHQVEGARAYDVIKTGQSDSARLDVILSKERPLVSSPMIGGRGGRSGRSGRSGMSGVSGRSGGMGSNLFGGSRGGMWGSDDGASDPNPWSVSEWHRPGSSDSMQQNNYNNNDDNSIIRWGDRGSINDGDNMHWVGDHDTHYDGIGDSSNGINHTAVTAMMWDSRVEQSEGGGGGGGGEGGEIKRRTTLEDIEFQKHSVVDSKIADLLMLRKKMIINGLNIDQIDSQIMELRTHKDPLPSSFGPKIRGKLARRRLCC